MRISAVKTGRLAATGGARSRPDVPSTSSSSTPSSSWSMDFKTVVYDAARDGNLSKLKVSCMHIAMAHARDASRPLLCPLVRRTKRTIGGRPYKVRSVDHARTCGFLCFRKRVSSRQTRPDFRKSDEELESRLLYVVYVRTDPI